MAGLLTDTIYGDARLPLLYVGCGGVNPGRLICTDPGRALEPDILRSLSELVGEVGADGLPSPRMAKTLAHDWTQILGQRNGGLLSPVWFPGRPLSRTDADGTGRSSPCST